VEFRNRLVGDTVRAAARDSEFYRALYAGLDLANLETVDDLARLPTVDKAMLTAAGDKALCLTEAGPTAAIQSTSGTTGAPFWLYRSRAEQEFIGAFFLEWNSREDTGPGPRPLVLQLVNDRHGVPTAVPSKVFPFSCRMMDESSVERAIELLRARFSIDGAAERISTLTGSLDDIVMFTTYLIEHGIDPAEEFAVVRLSPIGRYMTRRNRSILQAVWGRRVSERYSISEIFGGANLIEELNGYWFDPYLAPEVLALDTDAPLANGVGRLHLTGLRPFSIMQPLIRYCTNDLFEVATDDGVTVHRFKGRESHALKHPGKPSCLLTCGLAVLEAIDPHPEFNRDIHAVDIGVSHRTAAGWPRSRGRVQPSGAGFAVTVEVETVSDMRLFPERAEALKTDVRRELLSAAPRLAACVSDGEATVDVAFSPPGALATTERTSAYWLQ
jgi:hypothetical protein